MLPIRRVLHLVMLTAVFAFLFLAAPARAGLGAGGFEIRSAVSKVTLATSATPSTAPLTETFYWTFKTGGTLWDVVCTQVTAGTGGTSVSFNVLKNGTTMLSTLGTIPIGAGADKTIDARKEVAAVANTTRPVIKPQGAAIRVAKGDKITIVTTESGSYSPHPTYRCVAIFLPDL